MPLSYEWKMKDDIELIFCLFTCRQRQQNILKQKQELSKPKSPLNLPQLNRNTKFTIPTWYINYLRFLWIPDGLGFMIIG